MSDDLEKAMGVVEGEAPSPEFVARLRERVVAELSVSGTSGQHDSVVPIDIPPEQEEHVMTRTRLILAGLAAAVVAVVVGFVAFGGDERGLETITETEEPTTTEGPTTTPTTEEVATFAADAAPLPRSFESIQPGSHRADDFVRPFAFGIEQSMFVQQSGPTRIAISNVSSRDPGDKDIVFTPLLVDYEQWLGFITAGPPELNAQETTLGDLRVSVVDLEENSCGDDTFCGESGTSEAGVDRVFTAGAQYRIWVVELDDQSTFAVVAGIWDESDIVWFDVAEKVVSTLEFAPVEDE